MIGFIYFPAPLVCESAKLFRIAKPTAPAN